MKKLIVLLGPLALFYGCMTTSTGELMGVQERNDWFTTDPYGMQYVKMGSYNMGPNDQDVTWAMTAEAKTVSIHPFWMDQTEITNNEYRQFVFWVRDSIAKVKLGAQGLEEHLITLDEFEEEIDPPFLNWTQRIEWRGDDERSILEDMYLPVEERFYRRKEFDTRKLNFEYFWIDYRQAAKKFDFAGQKRRAFDFDNQKYDGNVTNWGVEKLPPDNIKVDRSKVGESGPVVNRASYIMKGVINVYPDTLCWISDFTFSYNEPMTKMYFWHPAYDHYPVVGVNWEQCKAFSIWRTTLYNGSLMGDDFVQDWRLPTESEWEYASRGGLKESMYPWGGYYTRNPTGCFIANFKPLRGNYSADGGFYPVIVAINDPNDYGLYDMAGNVAEWTSNAFDESAYSFTDDLNPDYLYDAYPDDPPARKRKVIRGGSWKDIGYYLQCGTRTYEYQDTAKSYIGFRCVRTYLGRELNDTGGSQVY